MGFLKWLSRSPSDMTIRLFRIGFGLLCVSIAAIAFWMQDSIIFWSNVIANLVHIGLFALFGLFFVISGSLTQCLLRRKVLARVYMISGVFAFVSVFFISAKLPTSCQMTAFIPMAHAEGSVSFTDLSQTSAKSDCSAPYPIVWILRILLVSFGMSALFFGLTGRVATTGCVKYGEKITKIRV